ncbi:MAG: GGDEF domain-containing protein [Lachnospiraceae bacterium]|nr:GGDEF domain-containing protein [Lachnospiraceae bacterium]
MADIENIKKHAENAIRSLYQMMIEINMERDEFTVLDINPELNILSPGIKDPGILWQELFAHIHPADRDSFIRFTDPDNLDDNLDSKVYVSFECRIRHVDRSYFWSEIVICNSAKEDEAGGNSRLLLIHDIHDRKLSELKKDAEARAVFLDLQQRYDALFIENMTDQQTGCYNRKGMKYYSDLVIREAKLTGKHLFVCVSDLNGLKHLNDTYGHAAGDEAIAAVSAELLRSAPSGTKIVRTGGDEFLMMAAIDKDSPEPEEMGAKIDKGLKEYNEGHSNPYEIGASYGWVLMPPTEGMLSLDDMVALADEKMYKMKLGRDRYRRK